MPNRRSSRTTIIHAIIANIQAGHTDMARASELASSRFCHLCGRRLVGRFVRYETGLKVCNACETTRPRCARCAVPLSDGTITGARGSAGSLAGPALCAECAKAAPRCAACKQAILGTFYTFEGLMPGSGDRTFCARCVQSRPRCDLCSAPVMERAAPVADGQWRCGLCATEMVLGEEAVQRVYREATAAFARVVGGRLNETPRLEEVNRREMGALRQRYGHTNGHASSGLRPGAVGADAGGHHVLGYFVYSHGKGAIYVERALPRPMLLGTLAHELGHAWQAERAPGLRDLLLCEGFAEWVAHRVLVAAGLHSAAAHATRRDDIYGRGLRHFLDLERAQGRAAVLATIQQR